MENFKGSKEPTKGPDWHEEIDWNAPDRDRQISLLCSKTCDELKDRPGFDGVYHRLTVEFAKEHPGPAGDNIYAEWMITRMRETFPRGE